jgi:CheY-like chemotaxis protein
MTPSSDVPPGKPEASPRKCILVVEDELLIRIMVSDELRDAGYDVIEACSADEAVTILTSPVRIDLIVSDVRMPGSLDGLGLLSVARERFPALPVIITSGHLEPAEAITKGANQFVPKPFPVEWVLKAVQDELAREL